MLNYLRKHNPRECYKHFRNRKRNVLSGLSNEIFYNHYNLATNEPNANENIEDVLSNYDENINDTIPHD